MIQVSEPEIHQADDVKIKVIYSGLGIEDLKSLRKDDILYRSGIVGWEMVGEIVALGDIAKAKGFEVGQQVTGNPFIYCGLCHSCQNGKSNCCTNSVAKVGTVCEYVVWKAEQLVIVDEKTTNKDACLVESVALAVEISECVHYGLCDSVAIYGCGLTALLVSRLLKLKGVGEVTIIGVGSGNKTLASSFGADCYIDISDHKLKAKLLKRTDYNGYDVVIDTSGQTRILKSAINVLAKGASLIFSTYFEPGKTVGMSTELLFTSAVTIKNILQHNNKIQIANKLLPRLKLDLLKTKTFPVQKYEEAFESLQTEEYQRIFINM